MKVFQEQSEHRTKHETDMGGPGGSALQEK